MIPEFPIRIGTISEKTDINQSCKIDYLVKAKNHDTIIFVELKTDDGSRRDAQDQYLARAKQAGMVELLEGVRKIYKATNSKKKYRHLLTMLHDMSFIVLGNNWGFEIPKNNYAIEIIYIQPNNPHLYDNVITFKEVSEIVGRHDDELSLRFSQSLLKWADTKAGEPR